MIKRGFGKMISIGLAGYVIINAVSAKRGELCLLWGLYLGKLRESEKTLRGSAVEENRL